MLLSEHSSRERVAALEVAGLACRSCARRAERALARIDGVKRASIVRGDGAAYVVYDGQRTTEASILAALAGAGYRARPSGAIAERAPVRSLEWSVAIGLVALGASFALSIVSGGEPSREVGLVKLALATVALLAGGRAVFDRRLPNAHRAFPDRETVALIAAGLAFLAGGLELAFVGRGAAAAPGVLRWLGFHAAAWRARPAWGLDAATAIVVATLVVKRAWIAVRDHAGRDLDARRRERERPVRRVSADGQLAWIAAARVGEGDRLRLVEGESAPVDLRLAAAARFARPTTRGPGLARIHREGEIVPAGAVLLSGEVEAFVEAVAEPRDAALDALATRALGVVDRRASSQLLAISGRAVTIAGVAFAAFAFIAHALFGGGGLTPTALFATVAALAAFSVAAFSVSAPVLERVAVFRARRLGVAIADASALDALATADTFCLDEPGVLASGAPRVTAVEWTSGPDRRALEGVLAAAERASTDAREDVDAGRARAIAAYLRAGGVVPSSGDDVAVSFEDDSIHFERGGAVVGRFVLDHPLRADAERAVRALEKRGVACRVFADAGTDAAATIRRRLGLAVDAGADPRDRALAVHALRGRGARIVRVSALGADDGLPIADGASDVTIAFAPGGLASPRERRFARASAARIVVASDLAALAHLVDLARSVRSRRMTLVTVAAVYNALVVPAAVLGFVAPILGAAMWLVEALAGLALVARLDAGRTATATAPSAANDKTMVKARARRAAPASIEAD